MRRSVRLAGTATAAVALLITGCGSDGDETADDQRSEQPADDETGGAGDAGDELDGVWGAPTEGGGAMLHLSEGVATLVVDDQLCLGGASGAAGQTVLALKCPTSTEYSRGGAALADDVLTVTWESGTEQEFGRLADGSVDLGQLNPESLDLSQLDPEQFDTEGLEFDPESFDWDSLGG